jgi:magnesium chelatase family protein
VLFLDELPEFRRASLEALRQPLEEHSVNLVRARQRATYPARPLMVSAMNPCPCGNWGSPQLLCRCKREVRLRYLSRISGPLLDRIDLHVVVPPADLKTWSSPASRQSTSTAQARAQVLRAREIQRERAAEGSVGQPLNSLLGLRELEEVAAPTTEGKALLEAAIERNLLSARGYVRVLRVARTLADLDEADRPGVAHIGEALRYRLSDLSEISPR